MKNIRGIAGKPVGRLHHTASLLQNTKQERHDHDSSRIQACQPRYDDRRKSDSSCHRGCQCHVGARCLHHTRNTADSTAEKHRPQHHTLYRNSCIFGCGMAVSHYGDLISLLRIFQININDRSEHQSNDPAGLDTQNRIQLCVNIKPCDLRKSGGSRM